MKMNRKGFTLVEVIAVVAIIGFLAIITIPAISRLSAGNNSKTVETFEKTLKNSAKAYINVTNQTITSTPQNITCTTLQGAGYIKQCTVRGYNCNNPYVEVRADSDRTKSYIYTVHGNCTKA